MEVWEFVCGGDVVGVGVAGNGPRSEAANRRVGLRKCDGREDVAVGNPSGTRVRRIVMGDARVGFDLADMGREAELFSYGYVVVGFHEEISMRVVLVVEEVDDVVSD